MPVRSILLAALLFVAAPALAQQSPIETRMTPEEFKAAGLDKLDAAELARLNAWLGNTIAGEAEKAAASAKREIEDRNRGFFNFGSSEPVTGRLVGDFRGFARGREYTLDNGQVWRQTDSSTLVGGRKGVQVRITPSLVGNAWYLAVEGYNTRAKVERIR